MMRGRIGNTTYYVAESRQLARQAMNNSNYGAGASRTERQQSRRVKLANLIHFYRFNRAFMQKAFGKLGGGVSVFNEFIKLNLNNSTVALTKNQALSPIWVPEGYQVTKGTLPELTLYGDPQDVGYPMYIDNINANYTAPAEGEDTRTLGGLAQYIIAHNPQFKAGDMITTATYIGIQEYSDDASTSHYVPQVIINQLILDPTSTEKIPFAWDPDNIEGLGLPVFSEGNFVVAVHSRNENGQLLVSTARMAKNTASIAEDFQVSEEWFSDAQVQKAIASYGVEAPVLLQPAE